MLSPSTIPDDRGWLAAQQLLARSSLDPNMLASGKIEIREPALFSMNDTSATLRHYVQVFDVPSGRLLDVRHAIWRLDPDSIGGWQVHACAEVPVGNEHAPSFLADGLKADIARAVGQGAVDIAVLNVLAGYGLAADAGEAGLVGDLYTPDTEVNIYGDRTYRGRRTMEAMIRGEFHRSLLPWAGHTMGPAMVWVDGDFAVSVHIGRTYGPPPSHIVALGDWRRRPFRYSVNRWELRRDADGRWRVRRRDSLPVPGPHWQAVLTEAVATMGEVTRGARSLTGAGERVRAALSAITAAAFAMTTGTACTGCWPFAAQVHLAVDGDVLEVAGSVLTDRLCGRLSCAGIIPTQAIARCEGRTTKIYDAVISYVESESGRVEPMRIDVARWTLNYRDSQWFVDEVIIVAGDSPAAASLLTEANDG